MNPKIRRRMAAAAAAILMLLGTGGVFTAGAATKSELEQKLAQDSYFRVNKGCLVNLEHVDQMDGEDAVVHGDRVPLARARRKAFLDALNDYINGVG